MYTFENTDTLEMDLYFEQAKYILSGMPSSDSIEYYTESENIISRAIDAVVNAFKAFFKKLHEIITGKKRDDAINNLEEAIRENPELGKEKVNVHDYKEMRKLQDETFNKLKKPNCDVSATMDDYRKKRKNLLVKIGVGVGAAIATAGTAITAAVLLKRLKSSKQTEAAAVRDGNNWINNFTQMVNATKFQENRIKTFAKKVERSRNPVANLDSTVTTAAFEVIRDVNHDKLEGIKHDAVVAALVAKNASYQPASIDPTLLNKQVPTTFAAKYRFNKDHADEEKVPNKKLKNIYQATTTGNLVRIQNDPDVKTLVAQYKNSKKMKDKKPLHDAIIDKIKSMAPDADNKTVRLYFNALVS